MRGKKISAPHLFAPIFLPSTQDTHGQQVQNEANVRFDPATSVAGSVSWVCDAVGRGHHPAGFDWITVNSRQNKFKGVICVQCSIRPNQIPDDINVAVRCRPAECANVVELAVIHVQIPLRVGVSRLSADHQRIAEFSEGRNPVRERDFIGHSDRDAWGGSLVNRGAAIFGSVARIIPEGVN